MVCPLERCRDLGSWIERLWTRRSRQAGPDWSSPRVGWCLDSAGWPSVLMVERSPRRRLTLSFPFTKVVRDPAVSSGSRTAQTRSPSLIWTADRSGLNPTRGRLSSLFTESGIMQILTRFVCHLLKCVCSQADINYLENWKYAFYDIVNRIYKMLIVMIIIWLPLDILLFMISECTGI